MHNPLNFIKVKSLSRLSKHLQQLLKTKLWAKVLAGMALGILIGILLGPSMGILSKDTSATVGNWLALPGNIFLGLIQMIVVPLVFASVISGLAATEDMDQLRQMGLKIVVYFLITTTIAITIGIVVATVIRPGAYIDSDLVKQAAANPVVQTDTAAQPFNVGDLPELVANILPQNPLSAMVDKQMLQVVLFALVLGLALVAMPTDHSKPLLNLLESIQEVCMTVVRWAMLLAPVAVFGLLAQITMKIGIDAIIGMAVYVGSVLLGLLLLLGFYLLIVTFIARKPPLWFLSKARDVQLLGFSTSSSAAVMPLSMKTSEEELGVRSSIAQFLIPLGATINMDGTALYQGVATVFLAQVYGVDLGIPALLLVVVTAVGASIGAPATPGVGIVILSMVLNSVGVPASGIALIIGVDRILDMSRTSVNVTGDLTASLVMNKWVK